MISKKFAASLVFWAIATTYTNAQVIDDFQDNDLTKDPEWSGDIASFNHQNGLLQSNGAVDGSPIYISTSTNSTEEQEWQLYLRLEFAPSGSNKLRFYLMADSLDLLASSTSLYLEIGQTGPDIFRLVHQNGNNRTTILESRKSYESTVEEFVRIVKKNEEWQLFLQNEHGEFVKDTSVVYTDNLSFHEQIYSGLACYYTSTRKDKFYFDNFYTGPPIADLTSPSLIGFNITSEKSLALTFSENIGQLLPNTKFLLNSNFEPASVTVGLNQIFLSFHANFKEEENVLTFSNVSDLAGNLLVDTMITFDYFKIGSPLAGDIIINEIMADPSPPVDLPEVEYLELWNRSQKHFDLSEFEINGKPISIEKYVIKKGAYVILCRASDAEQLSIYGNVAGMPSWDVLSNAGDIVSITYRNELIIDEVRYSATWYKSSAKSNGGFSLERRFEDFPCSEENNWSASTHEQGGTPGSANSNSFEPDLHRPEILNVLVEDPLSIRITLNEAVNPSSIQLSDFSSKQIAFFDFGHNANIIHLTPASPLNENTIYELTITELSDCFGNQLLPQTVSFVLPGDVEVGDIIINEILFDPFPSGVDFIELYNTSGKFLDLNNFAFSRDSIYLYSASSGSFILHPNQYVAITTDSNLLMNDYPHATHVVQVSSLPAMPNEGGELYLHGNDSIYDYFIYSHELHLQFLTSTEGVSLERISPEAPTNDPNNWHSAASTAGYATPGKMNSQTLQKLEPGRALSLSSPYLTPDQDGEKDFVIIEYNFNEPDYIGSVWIFDPFGKKIKQLSNNATLGSSGHFQWDGTSEDGELVQSGHYIIITEIFSLSGESSIFKEKVVVVR